MMRRTAAMVQPNMQSTSMVEGRSFIAKRIEAKRPTHIPVE